MIMAELDQTGITIPYCKLKAPKCSPQDNCFIASHVTPGTNFLVNTYLTRPDKLFQVARPDTGIRGYQLNCYN